MQSRKRKSLAALTIFAVLYGCAEARAVNRLRVEFWQDADSARYVISWVAGSQGSRQRATAYYDVELVSIGVTVASDTTVALTDTLVIAYPPLDSILPLLARVRAVDTDGDPSVWAESGPFILTTPKLPPSPPDSVRVDTTLVELAQIILRPSFVVLGTGDTVQFCSIYLMSDGTSGLTVNSRGITVCGLIYERWLTERSA